MNNETPTLDMRESLFPPPSDEALFELLEQAEEIAIAAVMAEKDSPTEWEEAEIERATSQATARWGYSKDTREIFWKKVGEMDLPPRPVIHNVHPILQHGIGGTTLDALIVWHYPQLRLFANEGVESTQATEDTSQFHWEIEEGEEGHLGILINTPLVTGDSLLGETLRTLTLFRLNLMILKNVASFPAPEAIYVLCKRDYAEAVSFAGFGAVIKEDIFTVIHPKISELR